MYLVHRDRAMATEDGILEGERWEDIPVGAGQEPLRIPLQRDAHSGEVRVKPGTIYLLSDNRKERPW